jgi:uncharacterized membrane protein (UPF0182 family)
MNLKITYDEETLFTKDLVLTDKQQARIVERVTRVAMTNEERIALAKAQQEAYEKTLTKEQKAEIARVAELKPEERQAEMLAKQKTALEAQLVQVTAQVTTLQEKLQPIKQVEEIV